MEKEFLNKFEKLKISKNIIKFLEKQSLDYLNKIKTICDDSYYNSEISLLSDEKYDILKDFILENDKDHKTTVGSKIRKDNNRVKLPIWLGSIDKIKIEDINKLENWKEKHKSKEYILEEKLDGVSALLTSDNGKLNLYTRGDGIIGSNITHLIKYITSIPKVLTDENIMIRGELIIKKNIFEKKYSKEFSNSRNMISGLVNSKTLKTGINDIFFIAYEIIYLRDLQIKPKDQFNILKTLDFKTTNFFIHKELNFDILMEELIKLRNNSEYEIDGIIILANEKYIRNLDGNPKYSFAFKMLLNENIIETEVEDVEWNVSKWGILKPRIKIKEVDLQGVKINYTTGFNGKFIYENKINKGTIVKITRSGDVIPYIVEIVKSSENANMPEKYMWNESKVDILIDGENLEENNQMEIKKITSFFKKLNVKDISEKTFEKIYNNGYNDIFKIIKITKEELLKINTIKEKTATKIHENINNSLKNISLPILLDASGIFGFGISIKKIEILFKEIPDILSIYKYGMEKNELIKKLMELEGFSLITAEKIVNQLENISIFIKKIEPYLTIKEYKNEIESYNLKNYKICFSGFRDPNLEKEIIKNGGEISDSVSKNTKILIVKNLNDISSKTKNAVKYSIETLTKEMFIDKYL